MYYDRDQFNRDLSLIADVFGERRQTGFYNEHVYKCDFYRIVDPYIAEPQIYVLGQLTPKDQVDMRSPVARFVLNKAVAAEEWLEQVGKPQPRREWRQHRWSDAWI
jgi:hypothetical protein